MTTANKKDINCAICLPVYNNEAGLPYCLANIQKIATWFNTLTVVAFYDTSDDRSLQILNEFDRIYPITILINTQPKSMDRTANIAFARNALLRFVQTNCSDCEYFITMDTNEYACIGDIQMDVFANVMENKKELWDAISFDRDAGYYDIWALSFFILQIGPKWLTK